MRHKTPIRRISAKLREDRCSATAPNECWSMDLVADYVFNGHRIRALSVVKKYGCDCLAITVDPSLQGDTVVPAVEHIESIRGEPKHVQVDIESEPISKALDLWVYENGVTSAFSMPK